MILFLPWIPILAALILLVLPDYKNFLLKIVSVMATAICLLIVFLLWDQYSPEKVGFQFVHIFPWLPHWGIYYQVGLDGVNLIFCLLHGLVSFAGCLIAVKTKKNLKEYLVFYLLLTGSIYGVFTSLNVFFLYLFYEMTLIPLFPMIGKWGSKNKDYGAMKLTIYITTGAVIGLFGILVLYARLGPQSLDLIELAYGTNTLMPFGLQKKIVPFILIGFGVIASLWPFHSWSPIGYAAAPTSVSMLHAGVLKKMGPYVIIRLAVTAMPEGMKYWSYPLAVLSVIGILYAGMAALWQKDLKYMVGFSSVSHMGYVLLGIAAMNLTGLSGAIFLMFSHGIMAACTFAIIGHLYDQTSRRDIQDYSGLVKRAPFIGVSFILASLASLGLPGFSNFVSELLVFLGAWKDFPILVALAVLGILITAIYLLRAVRQMCYGKVKENLWALKDTMTFTERIPYILLLGALILFGVWPMGLLKILQPTLGVLLV